MIDLTHEDRIRQEAQNLETHWSTAPRWQGIERTYSAEDVIRLRGSISVEHTLARLGAERLWCLMTTKEYVAALGALTGGQAVEMVKAGLKAIYLSGWQVAADANLSGQTHPDQSLYPRTSSPPSCDDSTTRSSARIRSRGAKARPARTGWRPSSPMPRPASAAR